MTVGEESSCVMTPFTPGVFTRTLAPMSKRCRCLILILDSFLIGLLVFDHLCVVAIS